MMLLLLLSLVGCFQMTLTLGTDGRNTLVEFVQLGKLVKLLAEVVLATTETDRVITNTAKVFVNLVGGG